MRAKHQILHVLAYTSVITGNYSDVQPSRLYNKNGGRITQNTLYKVVSNKDQANAVQSYLKKNGGILSMTVTDTPGIKKPTVNGVDKFRILTFDCGLRNMSPRIRAMQQLTLKGMVEAN